jgi:uncharacterized protein (DUF983 family)
LQKIILSRAKIITATKCPKCNGRHLVAFQSVPVKCKDCGHDMVTNPEVDIYASSAKFLIKALASPEIEIIAYRNDSKIFDTKDALAPRTIYERELYHAMLAMRNDLVNTNLVDVGKIETGYDYDYQRICNTCGRCLNCVTCRKCNKKYIPKQDKKGKNVFQCSQCKSKDYITTSILEFIKENGHDACPYCSSTRVEHTRLQMEEDKCPKCGSDDVQPLKKLPCYKFTISKPPRARP